MKRNFVKLYVDLQTALAAVAHLAARQWLEERLKIVQLRMFRDRT
jgi:hypothetical protein